MFALAKLRVVKDLFDEFLQHSEVSFDEYRQKSFFGEYVRSEIKLPLAKLSKKYESFGSEQLIKVLKVHMLFILECQRLSTTTQELSADPELSDWITGLAGSLSVCFPDRCQWKNFLNDNLVRNYGPCFGRTLYNVYLNLGLEPPECLPRDESELSETYSSISDNVEEKDKCAEPSTSTPAVTKSCVTRSTLRQSLPRALFADPAIMAAADVMSRSSPASPETARTPLTASTPALTAAHRSARDSSSMESHTSTSTSQLVLINSQRSRRKCRTPTKRLSVDKSRRSKNGQAPTDKSVSVSNSTKGTPSRAAQKHSNPATQQRRRTEPTRQYKSANAKRNLSTSGSDALVTIADAERKTPKSQYRRSVRETPNPERSYPRWERARLAAAEKTKNKAIIVEESPIKPATSMGSPLRRLRRANSMLANLLYVEARESAGTLSQSSSLPRDTEDALAAPSDQPGSDGSGCLSVTMSRAERWRRQRLEEECSLSQFTFSSPTKPAEESVERKPSGIVELSRLTPKSGLLCIPTSLGRENSNLFANMASPESQGSGFLTQSPMASPMKTPRKNIFHFILSPPPTVSPLSPRRTAVAGTACTPLLSGVYTSQSSPQVGHKPSDRKPRTPRTTPRRRLTVVGRCRARHSSGGGLPRAIPSFPQIFDEDAMFLGREEFLNQTNTSTTPGVESPLRTPSDTSDHSITTELSTTNRHKRHCAFPSASPTDAPVMRLSKAAPDNLGPSSKRLTRRQSHKPTNPIPTTLDNEVPEFLLKRPRRSPFAPLHVFNRASTTTTVSERDKGFPTSELLDCGTTTTASSQSASAVVALRTRLFGNSDSSDAISTDFDKQSTLENSQSTRVIYVAGASNDNKENFVASTSGTHPLDTPPSRIALVSHRKQLHHSVHEDVDLRKPLSTKECNFRASSLCSGSRTANARPRRSLFQ
ncbi:unnamed protein product [Dicrocoelium dendriticum]|nr:unnamed protein product [Dicrocoelium dendriticum]